MNTLIDVTGKLPGGLVEMYQKVDICAKDLGHRLPDCRSDGTGPGYAPWIRR